MEKYFDRLIAALDLPSLSNDVLQKIIFVFQQQTEDCLSTFVAQTYCSLVKLEHKIWGKLSSNHQQSYHQSMKFFQTLAAFNKKIIFHQDGIKDDMKMALLFPETIEQADHILQRVEQTNDDNDPWLTVVSLWFDNLAFLVHEYPRLGHLPMIIHINEYFGHHFLLSQQFKSYLIALQQPASIFTARQLFYMKTCPLFLNAFFFTNPSSCDYTPKEVIKHIGEDYLQMIEVQSHTVELWSRELLGCIAYLTGFIRAFLWWSGENGMNLKLLFSTEKILCESIQAAIRIIDYQPFYQSLMKQWSNDETILMDSILLLLMYIVRTQNIQWFFPSMTELPSILLKLADLSVHFRITLCSYGLLSEILTDENLKALKFTDTKKFFFFNMLEQAWRDPSKRYKQIPITYFLRGFLNLSKNDFVQQGTAKLQQISLFIEMCDEYPIAFDIIWALSFNQDIQQQLRSSSVFMTKLAHLAKESDDEQMRKTIHGILWNLEINHQDHSTLEINDETKFDVMISYSHKDKALCQQIYNELIQAGFRVWIDFDQMHGNVMDAMAQAIEQSETVIICMSEDYRKSNYCRAEAHYAFQRQRKIVPVILQKHYKPDGWLLFLIGQLLYVDFNKHAFDQAMKMLFKELKLEESPQPVEDTIDVVPPVVSVLSSARSSATLPSEQSILEWTEEQVQEWLIKYSLNKMSRLLSNCDGRSLVYLSEYMNSCQSQQILNLLQEDSIERTNQSVSLVELARFHSLMDKHRHLMRSSTTNTNIERRDC